MPRCRRAYAQSGIYHVMIRGIDKGVIFHDTDDCVFFTRLLAKYKRDMGFKVHAYCIMSNHAHLVIEEGFEKQITSIMRRLNTSYVIRYNHKYGRQGPLLQNRFRSEAIESDRSLLSVVRYVHQNPVKAGICRRPEGYAFSSYRTYIGMAEDHLTDKALVFSIIDLQGFIRLHDDYAEAKCLEYAENPRYLSDMKAEELIKKLLAGRDPLQMNKGELKGLMASLTKLRVRVKQMHRILGISPRPVQNA